jgi:hypothetical protein
LELGKCYFYLPSITLASFFASLYRNEELEYWKLIGLLDEITLAEAIEWKEMVKSGTDSAEAIKFLTLIFESALKPLEGICDTYNSYLDKISKTNKFINIFELDPTLLPNTVPNGLVARITQECLQVKSHQKSSMLSQLLEHVETPLQQLTRTGLGLLSRGLGK